MILDTSESDSAAPLVIGVMIPNSTFGIGSEVTVSIAVYAVSDTYSLVSGIVGGYEITNFTKRDDGLYHASFIVTEGGQAFSPGEPVPVNVLLKNSSGNLGTVYTDPIVLDYGLIDTARPAIVSATVEGGRIVLAYGEDMNLSESREALENGFFVKVGGEDAAIAAWEIGADGHSIILTLASSVRHGQLVTLSYEDPNPDENGDGLKDRGGNDSLGFSDLSVTNMSPDFERPVITGVSIPNAPMALGDVVTVTITVEPDYDTYVLGAGSFVGPYELTDLVKVDDATYTATFTITAEAGNIPAGDDIPVRISLTDSALNESGWYDASISQGDDPVDVVPSALEGAVVNRGILTLTFTEALDAINLPGLGAFEVRVGDRNVSVIDVIAGADGKSLSLLLASPASKGQAVTVSYRDPSIANDAKAVQDLVGNDTASFINVSALNTTVNELVGGVEVEREVVSNPDGSSDIRFKVPVIAPDRPGYGGSPGPVDIDLTRENGRGYRAQLPAGVGIEGWLAVDEATKEAENKARLQALLDKIEADRARLEQQNRDAAAAAAQRAMEQFQAELGDTLALRLSGNPHDRIVISQQREPGPTSKAPGALLLNVHDLNPNTTVEVHDAGFVAIFGEANFVGGTGRQYVQADGSRQRIVFGADDDTIHGGGGNDYIGSLGGDDWLYGDDGNDTVSGGIGNDRLFGGNGHDRLLGGSGRDSLDGGTGNDRLYGESGNDRLLGGAGKDSLYGGSGHDKLSGGSGNDTLKGDGGNDTLHGGSGSDALRGGTGKDRLYGEAGNDTLRGEAGDDWLVGGLGHDKIWGGDGADAFAFHAVQESRVGAQRDVIYDFQSGWDQIDLRKIDADVTQAGNQAFTWAGMARPWPFLFWHEDEAAFLSARFTGQAGQLRFEDGILMGDIDGDGWADFEIGIVGHFSRGDVLL